ncbi:hypothetical protein [Falsigemmobacter faecalis]|uniref:Uncharacterized protein n=1 Tax=Falsigemmobacter faecalis TaxID=2488730 RepID=A0A3P3DCB9_9RHOB|nr:hypothetical protein [Falsigemmobacter faecalis]RRH71973.1 hypothetical protein EG244_15785 [Falsigemmobacter faecalis]
MNAMNPLSGPDTALPVDTCNSLRKSNFSNLFDDGETHNLEVSARRAAYVAEVLGVDPPARLVDEEDCLSPEVMDFVRHTGASLDFIFVGDLRGMILTDCERRLEWFTGKSGEA